ncbi:hypothetical protein ACFL2Q_03770, partial [Thermodesulfobacteriota bacterium]
MSTITSEYRFKKQSFRGGGRSPETFITCRCLRSHDPKCSAVPDEPASSRCCEYKDRRAKPIEKLRDRTRVR